MYWCIVSLSKIPPYQCMKFGLVSYFMTPVPCIRCQSESISEFWVMLAGPCAVPWRRAFLMRGLLEFWPLVGPWIYIILYIYIYSNEKKPSRLGMVRENKWDYTTHVILGIIIKHYKDSYKTASRFFCSWLICSFTKVIWPACTLAHSGYMSYSM